MKKTKEHDENKRKPLFTSKAVLLSVLVFIIGAVGVITLGDEKFALVLH